MKLTDKVEAIWTSVNVFLMFVGSLLTWFIFNKVFIMHFCKPYYQFWEPFGWGDTKMMVTKWADLPKKKDFDKAKRLFSILLQIVKKHVNINHRDWPTYWLITQLTD